MCKMRNGKLKLEFSIGIGSGRIELIEELQGNLVPLVHHQLIISALLNIIFARFIIAEEYYKVQSVKF